MTQNHWVAALAIVMIWNFEQHAFAETPHEKQSPDVKHSHHEAQGITALTLNAGKKWATDAPLRAAMANIHQAMLASLDEIHSGKLNDAMYDTLAATTKKEVANMVSQCKLPPDADAQLHLVIAELSLGADIMAGKQLGLSREKGAVKVMGALKNYSLFFEDDHPHWGDESGLP